MVLIQEEIDLPYVQLSDTEEDEKTDATATTAEDEIIDYEDLKKRIWKDRVLLQKMKEKLNMDESDNKKAKQEASRKKKMSRAQDSVLKYMVKIMEVCKARGFVYGIVPENGKPITGSSDSLREWWKENIRFDQTAPKAIAKEGEIKVFESSPISSINNPLDHVLFGGGSSGNNGGSEKRKCDFDSSNDGNNNNNSNSFVDKPIYTCQNVDCPQSDLSMGFRDKNSRMDHESMCAFRSATLDHQGINSSNENSKAFHDYLSSEERMTSVGDWMNMEVAKANNNNNNLGDTDFGDIDIMNGTEEIAGEAFGEDNLGLWLNDIEDCELFAALEMVKANSVMDSTHQNNNPPLIKHDHFFPHDGHLDDEATTSSLWDYASTSFKSNNI
ncbi:hypothetical protein Ahy_B10g102032 [Arachis hypogaea]|uniref:Ethylene insensitive 3-like DNA-binding domain-containing protein n=1 Tax=Arachis hypogaea TaxID=3818 RepID=A0A444X0Y0_ARAHY|nr:hypothetical protein Ahy_B10g102032 [Arachis hypogaea]